MKLKKMKGLWFGPRKSKAEKKTEEIMNMVIKHLPALKKLLRDDRTEISENDGKIIGLMYDFYQNYNGSLEQNVIPWVESSQGSVAPVDDRVVATPLAVMGELETIPTPFNSNDAALEEKISTLKDKTLLLNQRYAKQQIEGLIKRLENRKRYKEQFEFYGSFPNTTDQKIDDLLKKYKLEIKQSDLFVPTFPKEAVDIMKKYTEITKKITGEKPVFYVIAEHADFVKKMQKLDPILLAQSPFGFFWQILGAWDKEMLLLSEL